MVTTGARSTDVATPRRVEVVFDLVCVHCYLGFARCLRAVRRYRGEGGAVETVPRPCQLQPAASPAGEPLVDVWARQRGAEVAARLAADTSLGAADGLTLDFRRAVFTDTFAAHRLVARAAARGLGEAAAERLFRAHFADGLNIADPDTLARLAAEIGVADAGGTDAGGTDAGGDADALRAELARVRALGLPAPPVFRFPDGTVLPGEDGEIREEDLLAALR